MHRPVLVLPAILKEAAPGETQEKHAQGGGAECSPCHLMVAVVTVPAAACCGRRPRRMTIRLRSSTGVDLKADPSRPR
jgi:hypothetical protein